MPTINDRFPNTWNGRPQSMPVGDWVVWQRFLTKFRYDWPEYAYDVELEGSSQAAPDVDPTMRRTWARMIAKRIDVLAFRPAGVTIIEARTRATWQSLGQIIGYRYLLQKQQPQLTIEACAIVTDYMDPQIVEIANANGINVTQLLGEG